MKIIIGKQRKNLLYSFPFVFTPIELSFAGILPLLPIWNYRLNLSKQANPHILICGASGYGKSTLCKTLIGQITRWKPVLCFDIHNEYVDFYDYSKLKILSPLDTSINLWELSNESPKQKIAENLGILKLALNLGSVQQYYLEQVAYSAYLQKGIYDEDPSTWQNKSPTNKDILDIIKARISGSRKDSARILSGLYRRLSGLESTGLFKANTEIPVELLAKESICFKLGDIKNDAAQIIFVEIVLRKLFKYLQNEITHDIKMFVLIDEAQKICKEKAAKSFISQVASEVRKYGMGIISVTQMPTLLDKSIVANSATKITFYHDEPEEFNYVVNIFSRSEDYKERKSISSIIKKLKIFQCLIISTSQKNPIKLKVKKIFLKLNYNKSNKIQKTKEKEDILSFLKKNNGFCEEKDLCINEKDLKELLEKKKIISRVSLKNLEGETKNYVGLSEPHKSLEHFVYIRLLSDKLNELGIKHIIRDGAYAPDLEFVHNNKRIAIEYETGKKFHDEDVIKMLKRRNEFDRVIVVVKPEDYQRYSKICKKIKNCEAVIILKFSSLIEQLKKQ